MSKLHDDRIKTKLTAAEEKEIIHAANDIRMETGRGQIVVDLARGEVVLIKAMYYKRSSNSRTESLTNEEKREILEAINTILDKSGHGQCEVDLNDTFDVTITVYRKPTLRHPSVSSDNA